MAHAVAMELLIVLAFFAALALLAPLFGVDTREL
jgi:hypothetical protein